MDKPLKILFLLPLIVMSLLLVGSCVAGVSQQPTPAENVIPPTIPPAGQPADAASQELPSSPALATPYADSPASGICAEAPGELLVSVEIYPDIPSPRCLKVSPEQKLQVFNRTDSTLQLSLGNLEDSLEPENDTILDVALGDYLAPGVHRLSAEPYSGPEIWLVE